MSEKLFRNRYRISSTRLHGFDYSQEGYYFITICTKDFSRDFGVISDERMIHSDAGKIIHKQWLNIDVQFENAIIDVFIVMPDHFHGIIQIHYPSNFQTSLTREIQYRKEEAQSVQMKGKNINAKGGITGSSNPMLSHHSVSKIIGWFKGSTTFLIRKNIDPGFEWQPGYYDRIIWNDRQLENVRNYIRNNPIKWKPHRLGCK